MNVLLVGYGRMGRAIEKTLRDRGHQIVARIGPPESAAMHHPRMAPKMTYVCHSDSQPLPIVAGLKHYFSSGLRANLPDVAIEFSQPNGAADNVQLLLEHGIPTVSGTTGWDPSIGIESSRRTQTAFLHAANFSMGMAVTRHAVRIAARLFAGLAEFQPAIFERHHRAKMDRPSGTAKMLSAEIRDAGWDSDIETVCLRQGGVPGEHTVYFEGTEECVEITHRARSRAIFSLGAVMAGEWIATERPRGPVTIDDFLERTCPWNAEFQESSRRS